MPFVGTRGNGESNNSVQPRGGGGGARCSDTTSMHSMHNAAWIISKHFVFRADRDIPRTLVNHLRIRDTREIDLFATRLFIYIYNLHQ